MYQQQENCPFTEKDLKNLTKDFEKNILKLDSNPVKLDLSLFYVPNHACAWNKPSNIGEKCRIAQKNDKLCFVIFMDKKLNKDVIENLYRIEDLSPLKTVK